MLFILIIECGIFVYVVFAPFNLVVFIGLVMTSITGFALATIELTSSTYRNKRNNQNHYADNEIC